MYKNLIVTTLFAFVAVGAKANITTVDTSKTAPDPPLVFSGSVDTYFKYDFSGRANIPTSFANEQNSVSIGMIDLGLKKTVGKASFVGELSFGPRGQQQSIPNADPGLVSIDHINGNPASGTGVGYTSYHIQNLYVSYNVRINLT